MHSSQFTHIAIKNFIKIIERSATFANKDLHAMKHTRFDDRKVCMKSILVTEKSLVGCSR
jgi:hypothetical protein